MAEWTQELIDSCAIGSEASDPAALRVAAAWTAQRLRRLGAEVDVVELDGVPPLVLGSGYRFARGRRGTGRRPNGRRGTARRGPF